jgi:hypothetical protein
LEEFRTSGGNFEIFKTPLSTCYANIEEIGTPQLSCGRAVVDICKINGCLKGIYVVRISN